MAAGIAPVFSATFECGPSVHDAGRVAQGRDLVTDVTCRNVSDHTVELAEIHSGCPCLVVTPNSSATVPPGGVVRLHLKLSTDGLTDRVGFPVEAVFRPGAPPVPLFHYEADVRPAIIAIPEYIDLGDWKKGGGKQIILVDTTGGAFGIEKASAARGAVDVQWAQVGLLRVDDRWTVTTGKSAVSGYLVTVQPRQGARDGRRSLSDEVQLELKRSVQRSVRVRVVGFSP